VPFLRSADGGGDKRERRARLERQETLENLVQRVLEDHRLTAPVLQEHVRVFWSNLVGQVLGRNTEPGQFDRGTMNLFAKTSTWMHELHVLKTWIAAQVNFGMRHHVVGDIKLKFSSKVGQSNLRAQVRELEAENRSRRPPPPRTPTPAGLEASQAILAETAQVDDEDLRELIAKVRTKWDR
jgi:Dna[CI] antecedent, DciA